MRILNLHLGHGKTGSSYIQSALALSVAGLAEAGVAYPDLTGTLEQAKQGRISSGNIHANQKPLTAYVAEAEARVPAEARILFSNELLFPYVLKADGQAALAALVERGVDVRMLCFVRDPLDHAVSLYQQVVKRSGYTNDLATFLETYSVPHEVEKLMNMAERIGLSLTVSNYSRHKKRVLAVMAAWLDLPDASLVRPDQGVVNRSLSAGELVLQRAFNEHLGRRSSGLISDPLCNQLPDIKSEYPGIRRDELAPFLDRMAESAARVNRRIAAEDAYEVPHIDTAIARFRDPDDPDLLRFTDAQFEVVARRLSRRILELEERIATLEK